MTRASVEKGIDDSIALRVICACSIAGLTASCFSSSVPGDTGVADATALSDGANGTSPSDGEAMSDSSTSIDSSLSLDSAPPSDGGPETSTDATTVPTGTPEAGPSEAEAAAPACAADLGKIYVADGLNNDRIVRIDDMCGTNWVTLSSVPGPDASTRSVGSPEGLFVDSAGKIYIAETFGADQIIRMDDMTGANWTSIGTSGSGPLQFNAPKNVFVDSTGHIYVTDSFNYRIVRMDDMAGTNWVTFGTHGTGPNQFSFPTSIFVDGGGHIYVTDSDTSNSFDRVVRIDDMTGTNWTTFGSYGSGVDQFSSLWGVFVDPAGHIFLTDAGVNGRVVRIDDMTGTNWTTFGTFGAGAVGDFYSPASIFVDANGRIYVIDAANQNLGYGSDNGVVRMDDMTGKNWIRFGTLGAGVNEFSQATGLWLH